MMSFSYGKEISYQQNKINEKIKNKIKNKMSTLRTYHIIFTTQIKSLVTNKKRISLFTGKFPKKASITVEASLTLPFFLFLVWILMYIIEIFSLYGNIQSSLHQQAKELSKYAYIYHILKGEDQNSVVEGVSSLFFTESYVKERIITDLGQEYLDNSCIRGGAGGISFLKTGLCEEDMIDIVAEYTISLPFKIINHNINIIQRCRIHAFTGYNPVENSEDTGNEEIVYITKTGTVYHRDRNCSHIQLTIEEVSLGTITNRRNAGGEKYTPCEICDKNGFTDRVYITEDGNRYHSSLSCSGLKRIVFAVPISKVGNRHACARCGG